MSIVVKIDINMTSTVQFILQMYICTCTCTCIGILMTYSLTPSMYLHVPVHE